MIAIKPISECIQLIKTHFEKQKIEKHFPNIIKSCLENYLKQLSPNYGNSEDITLSKDFQMAMTEIAPIFKNLYQLLKDLSDTKYFCEHGNNFEQWKIIKLMIELISKTLVETTRKNKLLSGLIKCDLNICFSEGMSYKIDKHVLELQSTLSDKTMRKDKDSLNNLSNEMAKIFWVKYFPEESNVSWSEFIENFLKFIKALEEITISDQVIVKIRAIIDEHYNSSITAKNVNLFFNVIWANPEERRNLLLQDKEEQGSGNFPGSDSQGSKKDSLFGGSKQVQLFPMRNKKKEPEKEQIKVKTPILTLIVKNIPNKDSAFNEGDKFVITSEGFNHPSNSNFKADGVVRFGRRSKKTPAANDIYFAEKESYVSRKQFQIVFKPNLSQYFIMCTSNANPTLIKILDLDFDLSTGTIFQLADEEYFIVRNIFINPKMLTKAVAPSVFGEEESTISRKFKENEKIFKEAITPNFFTITPKSAEDQHKKFDLESTSTVAKEGRKATSDDGTTNLRVMNSYLEIEGLKGEYAKSDKGDKKLYLEFKSNDDIITLGRHQDCKVQFENGHISMHHAQIKYVKDRGFVLGERLIPDQDKFSENGTFAFLKSYDEYVAKDPSKSILLKDKMVISIEGVLFYVQIDTN